jgi:cyclopropane fatty-acyl-phospholipid synthase-like methyltransferase
VRDCWKQLDGLSARGWLALPRDASMRQRAKEFVGTDDTNGNLQLALLVAEGCTPASSVLEVGCGALHTAVPTVRFLDAGQYVGIDPATWLREAAMTAPAVRRLMSEKQAEFLDVDNFDASSLGRTYDFVISHSILSHAAAAQLPEYLANTSKVLSARGKILASLRLAEGNDFGSAGSPDGADSEDGTWVYPGVSYFTVDTLRRTAASLELDVEFKPEYTALFTAVQPHQVHDWVVFTRTAIG